MSPRHDARYLSHRHVSEDRPRDPGREGHLATSKAAIVSLLPEEPFARRSSWKSGLKGWPSVAARGRRQHEVALGQHDLDMVPRFARTLGHVAHTPGRGSEWQEIADSVELPIAYRPRSAMGQRTADPCTMARRGNADEGRIGSVTIAVANSSMGWCIPSPQDDLTLLAVDQFVH